MNKHSRFYLLLTLLSLLLTACGGRATPTPIPANNSTQDWQVSTPAEQGMDATTLDQMLAAATKLNLHSLLVIRHGRIVAEAYYGSYQQAIPHTLYSVTKSFTATLVGIAADKGLLHLEESVLSIFPERQFANLDERKQAMTVEHLLTMASGLNWLEGDPTYTAMYQSADWVQYVLDLPMEAQPGSMFKYCSGCSHVLMAIVEAKTGMPALDFARQNLFEPLGLQDLRWETDAQGIPIGGWGLNITPRQMAKLGYLYLHAGMWDGKQVISAQWVGAATQKHSDPAGDLQYGYQWWVDPGLEGYAALGRYGQTIFVLPKQDVVVVFTAQMDSSDEQFRLIREYVVKAVTEP